MQGPHLELQRRQMLDEINQLGTQVELVMKQNPAKTLQWLLGGVIEGIPDEVRCDFLVSREVNQYNVHTNS